MGTSRRIRAHGGTLSNRHSNTRLESLTLDFVTDGPTTKVREFWPCHDPSACCLSTIESGPSEDKERFRCSTVEKLTKSMPSPDDMEAMHPVGTVLNEVPMECQVHGECRRV